MTYLEQLFVYLMIGLVFVIVLYVGVSLIVTGLSRLCRSKMDRRIDRLVKRCPKLTPEQFQKFRRNHKKNFSGIYVLYNRSKHMYYVGQAVKVLDRVNKHFTGKGNGDVYADYKYGDKFVIRLIPLKTSGFPSLNDLERYAIARYRAYEKGYNKTRGNKGVID